MGVSVPSLHRESIDSLIGDKHWEKYRLSSCFCGRNVNSLFNTIQHVYSQVSWLNPSTSVCCRIMNILPQETLRIPITKTSKVIFSLDIIFPNTSYLSVVLVTCLLAFSWIHVTVIFYFHEDLNFHKNNIMMTVSFSKKMHETT